ncbi:hypothetical protein [Photobacterium salinisoli]|uniref:hypothetical protein n=1 Tax=Photobacterium salinisoli TaxID=1616783 RepID=UPI000EA2FEE0|nr:hypothetical protein [Photobacterium salinisoli]
MDVFLGCRRRERLQLARTTPEKQRHFWLLFVPAKSNWRASHHGDRYTELKRDILTQPLKIALVEWIPAFGAGSAYNRLARDDVLQSGPVDHPLTLVILAVGTKVMFG